jgi:GNAT superfamily N-acetyltransferase
MRPDAMSISGSISQIEQLAADWVVRAAVEADAESVAAGVHSLLVELGADPPAPERLAEAARTILADPHAGMVFVAQAGDDVIGVLSASLQQAIHVPGRYATVQDLWVDPAWRGHLIGAGLVDALVAAAGEDGLKLIEVGLPKASYRRLEATEGFYLANGFTAVGPRMRRVVR